jgi:hypothetical protein
MYKFKQVCHIWFVKFDGFTLRLSRFGTPSPKSSSAVSGTHSVDSKKLKSPAGRILWKSFNASGLLDVHNATNFRDSWRFSKSRPSPTDPADKIKRLIIYRIEKGRKTDICLIPAGFFV